MGSIDKAVEGLRRCETRGIVDARMREFAAAGKKTSSEIFNELCFCILTANFNAERSIKIQRAIGSGFLKLPEKKLVKKLKALGHRFPNARAKYIVEARKHAGSLKEKIESFKNEKDAREWLVKNIRGLGYKEASHFLRNTGRRGCAIIDFHIIDLLARHGLIKKPKTKTLSKKNYIEIESRLEKIAEKLGTNLGELDLYLWCAETGKVLK